MLPPGRVVGVVAEHDGVNVWLTRWFAAHGKQRAIVAIEHSLLTAIWHMLNNNVDYNELGPDHFTRGEPAHVMRRITKQAPPDRSVVVPYLVPLLEVPDGRHGE